MRFILKETKNGFTLYDKVRKDFILKYNSDDDTISIKKDFVRKQGTFRFQSQKEDYFYYLFKIKK